MDGGNQSRAELERRLAKAERRAQRATEIVETAPDALLLVNGKGEVVFANRRCADLLGYRHADLLGQSLEHLLPERFRAAHFAHLRHYFAAPRVRSMGTGLELYARRADGSEFPVEISLSPIRLGEETLVASAIRDASERSDIERRLREARRRAEVSASEKARFIAAASHDLRQPLQAAAIYLDLLSAGKLDPEDVRPTAEKAKLCIDSLRAFLDQVLHISKLDAGVVRPNRVSFRVQSLFDRLQGQFEPLASTKGLRLRVRTSALSAFSDPTLTGRILENFVSNAVRYTDSGGVLIGCRRRGDEVRLQVWDTGVGIESDELDQIFDAFFRRPEDAADDSGIGLGLAIAAGLANLLDHRIEVRSRRGSGSLFELVLPRVASLRPEASAKATIQTRGSGCVAVLDNSRAIVDALTTVLQVAGNRVVAATTIGDLLDRLHRSGEVPEALVTDYRLTAEKTGLDALADLRRHLGRAIPAILLTGDSSFDRLQLAGQRGGYRVLAKPVAARELLAEIDRCLAE